MRWRKKLYDALSYRTIANTPVGPLVFVASRGVTPSSPVTAAFPVFTAGRLPHYAFRGLLSVHSRYGLPARGVARGDPLHRRLRRRSDCYRLERRELPDGICTR
jgi:hypothetical protein